MHKTPGGGYFARPSRGSGGKGPVKSAESHSQGSTRAASSVILNPETVAGSDRRRQQSRPERGTREPSPRTVRPSDVRRSQEHEYPAQDRSSRRSEQGSTRTTYEIRTRPESPEERDRRRRKEREEKTAKVLSDLAQRTPGQSKVWMKHGQDHLDLARSDEEKLRGRCGNCTLLQSKLDSMKVGYRGRKALLYHEVGTAKADLKSCKDSHAESDVLVRAEIDRARDRATWCLTMCRMTPQPLTSRWITDSVQVPDAAQVKAFERLTRETDPAKRTEHRTVWKGTSTRTAEDLARILHSLWPTIRKALGRYDSCIPSDIGYQEPSAEVFSRCFDIIANQPELFSA